LIQEDPYSYVPVYENGRFVCFGHVFVVPGWCRGVGQKLIRGYVII